MTKTIKTTTEDADVLKQLREAYPTEPGSMRIQLPRLGMVSQDKTEGKGKAMKVVEEAGTFFIEQQTDEVNEEGKKVWVKDELGTKIEGVILFQRKQLRMYDESTEEFTSSPVYDTDDEIVPLWCNKKEIARDTPAKLKAMYKFVDKEGKEKSKLEDNRILYILYKGTVYQMNLRGSSMYSFMTYARKNIPNTVITRFSSGAKEKGTIAWNQMTFDVVSDFDAEFAREVLTQVDIIRKAIAMEKAQFVTAKTLAAAADKKADADMDEIAASATKALDAGK